MLRNITLALLLIISIPAVADQINALRKVPTSEELRQQYAVNLEKAAKDQQESHERNLKLIAREEVMIDRQEKDLDRFEKILDTWERQQAQYQKYLDSLAKK